MDDDPRSLPRRAADRLTEALGGPARRRVVLILAAVLGLDTADKAALSAVATNLKDAFGVGNTAIGLLVSVVLLVGAAATLPIGVLTDRVDRTRLLAITIALWTFATLASGAAPSYGFLLGARVLLGAVTATANPTVASLVGDYFPSRDRGRMYGLILAGELAGAGFGFVVASLAGDLIGWRWAFWALTLPGALTGWLVWRHLPEPARGGQSRIAPGQEHIRSAADVGPPSPREPDTRGEATPARRIVREQGVEPRPDLVLHEDPRDRSLWWAARYVLKVPTLRSLYLASALVYFYFSGLRAFAVIYISGHFGVAQATTGALLLVLGVGAVAGVVLGGRLSDRLVERGHLSGRIALAAVAVVASALLFAPAIASPSLWIAVPLLSAAAFALAAANPSIDAARLDVIHPHLWGRSESVRTMLRKLAEAAAPILFGLLSESVFGGGTRGLEWTLLLGLLALLGAALCLRPARRAYPRDVATNAASIDATLGAP
jgi:predicted MFS family arabinose efflux permease